jgi:hypothetical protein
MLSQAEEGNHMKGSNFSVENLLSNLDMAYAVESVVSELPQTLGMELGAR